MIVFKRLTWRNFLSTGNTPIEMELAQSATTLIIGSNGSGKSTMLDALSFALFGKPHRGITKPQLVNSINQKDCIVTLEFQIATMDFKIVRGIKPAIFEIWQSGVMINQESHSRDYQKLLESNILKLNHKSFHQIVVLGSSNFTPFMQLAPWYRREVIEDLLDIGIFTKMNILLKDRQGKLKDTISSLENLLVIAKEKIFLQNKHLDELKKIDQGNSIKIQNEIKLLELELQDREKSLAVLEEQFALGHTPAVQALKKEKSKQQQLFTYGTQIKSNLERIKQESVFYQGHSTCPTCQQEIGDQFKHVKTTECSRQLSELSQGYQEIQATILELQGIVQLAEKKLNTMFSLSNEITSNHSAIQGLRSRIKEFSSTDAYAASSVSGPDSTKLAEIELQTLRDDRDRMTERRAGLLEDRTYNDILGELLKDTGIKTKVIRQYLPLINKCANNYLGILDFFVSFTLDESFTEVIRSRHRDDFSYNSFSEGEKQRIDLALIFTWRQIAKMKNSANTNLLILDETFDSSMDVAGVDNLMKILTMLKTEGTNIFVISHKSDLLDNKFPLKLEFQRQNNFSKMIQHS